VPRGNLLSIQIYLLTIIFYIKLQTPSIMENILVSNNVLGNSSYLKKGIENIVGAIGNFPV
jgi:hypothetical protein